MNVVKSLFENPAVHGDFPTPLGHTAASAAFSVAASIVEDVAAAVGVAGAASVAAVVDFAAATAAVAAAVRCAGVDDAVATTSVAARKPNKPRPCCVSWYMHAS